jgi:hypothetical protein
MLVHAWSCPYLHRFRDTSTLKTSCVAEKSADFHRSSEHAATEEMTNHYFPAVGDILAQKYRIRLKLGSGVHSNLWLVDIPAEL